ncbi:MAG TPA: hypothetical protein VH120_17420, partial [Gemmataceae bacterium]|nr:hypothetical protein [Gemmataceae bacterium]
CLNKAGISNPAYYKARREAEVCGVLNHFDRYLRMESPYDEKPRSGLAAPKFLIPTPEMLKVRQAAIDQGAGQNVWANQQVPGFEDWFLDWVAPKSYHGQRIPISRAEEIRPASAKRRSTAKPRPILPDGGTTRTTPTTAAEPLGTAHNDANSLPPVSFIPTRFQLGILKVLSKRFLTKEKLMTALGIGSDSKHLYYEGGKKGNGKGLDGLLTSGLVRNDRGQGRGFYSVESAPPEIADFVRAFGSNEVVTGIRT